MSIHIKVTLPYLFLLQNKKKEHTTLCMFSFCMWSPILYFEVAIQSFELFRFHFFCNISIDVQCSWNIWMSECVLNDLYIYSSFTHSCCSFLHPRMPGSSPGTRSFTMWPFSSWEMPSRLPLPSWSMRFRAVWRRRLIRAWSCFLIWWAGLS